MHTQVRFLICFMIFNSTFVEANENLIFTLDDPTETDSDLFGLSVDLNDKYLLVGALGDDTYGSAVGQAHLYDVQSGNLLQTFDDPTVTRTDYFGVDVALHGNNVLIGASSDETNGNEVGQAYLFDALSGDLLRIFDDPSITNGDQFGDALDISENYVLIGAPALFVETYRNNIGEAYLFDVNTGNLLHTFNHPNNSAGPWFGADVAIDGNHILIGSPFDDSNHNGSIGEAYLYDAISGDLLHIFNDPTPTYHDHFGLSVAIDGNYVVIGAHGDWTLGQSTGQIHIFDLVTGDLLHTLNGPILENYSNFGWIVEVQGEYVIVSDRADVSGSRHADGHVYVFHAATGKLIETFNDPTVSDRGSFGSAIAIHKDKLLIGSGWDDSNSSGSGQVHLFILTVPEPGGTCLLLSMIFLGRVINSPRNFRV